MSHHASGSVVWTRGRGCLELAQLLGGEEAMRISGDVSDGCVDARAGLLVARRFPGNFELINVAVPVEFDPESVTEVVATVSGGPHSLLAASVAQQVGNALGVPSEMVAAAPDESGLADARAVLADISSHVVDLDGRVLEVGAVSELVENIADTALLVLGAPGGSWLQRLMFGPGARLRRVAQAGSVVVRSAPSRAFQHMAEPVYVAPLRSAADILRFHDEKVLAVAEEGRLVGVVGRGALLEAGETPVGELMAEPQSVRFDTTLEDARELEAVFEGSGIPVVDDDGHLIGSLTLSPANSE